MCCRLEIGDQPRKLSGYTGWKPALLLGRASRFTHHASRFTTAVGLRAALHERAEPALPRLFLPLEALQHPLGYQSAGSLPLPEPPLFHSLAPHSPALDQARWLQGPARFRPWPLLPRLWPALWVPV